MPLDNPEVEWLTDGSRFVVKSFRKAGYTVVSYHEREGRPFSLIPLPRKQNSLLLFRPYN
jgi:hypothetical protein